MARKGFRAIVLLREGFQGEGKKMLLKDFVGQEMPEAAELEAMMGSAIAGAGLCRLEADPFDSRTFRKLARKYADSGEGPFGQRRICLYHQVHKLFEALRKLPGNKGLKGYELKDSFIGSEEADLVMLTASHEGMSQEALAHEVLYCSKNAVGERRARMKDGIRLGGMCVEAEFGYRGDFQSSVHPVSLPLNLSEVYVLLEALSEHAGSRGGMDPHRQTALRLAGMVKSQLSGYARERLQSRLDEMGFGALEDIDPIFRFDSPKGGEGDGGRLSDPLHWVYYEKSGVPACVELADGSMVEGVILSGSQANELLESLEMKVRDPRPYCIVYRGRDDFDIVPWAEVVDVRACK